ncbi:TPA: capsule biosynthesis GfcC D2 domain-containing protein [Escherichia coli]
MIKQTIVALILSVGASSVFAAGTVKVFSNGSSEAKTLTGAEYLIDLVGQPRLANSWWPGAVISEELATAAALRQQQALLTRLAELAADSSADDAAAINALRQQIQALKVTGRQKINLDPDIVRVAEQINLDPDIVRVAERGNPPLQGNYTLWVGPPPSTVTLFGLISRPGKQPFTPGRDVASYLSGQNLLSGADRSYAWVVYPDGRTQKAPVAYWNKRHVEPMPGSIIYVGLADSVWSETPDALNADILQTLTQRIPQ